MINKLKGDKSIAILLIAFLLIQSFNLSVFANNEEYEPSVQTEAIGGEVETDILGIEKESGEKEALDELEIAPIDEKFIDQDLEADNYEMKSFSSRSYNNDTTFTDYEEAPKKTGLKPEPFTLHFTDKKVDEDFPDRYVSTFRSAELTPKEYDLREFGKVTSVRDQGPNGSCWAFATYGCAESILRPAYDMDFSEKHMRNTHGFDWGPDDGGNRSLSSAYFARWSGPVLEEYDPYDTFGYKSPKDLPIAMHLDKAIYLPDKEGPYDNEMYKKIIMEQGAIYSAINASETYLNKKTMGHYYRFGGRPDHAITIIGWDDNYSKNNFLVKPPTDGAWIAKNSWGNRWGTQGGYYYISYHDKNVMTLGATFHFKELDNQMKIWSYDPLGMTSQVGFGEETWAANVFGPVKEDVELKEVGLYLPADNASYEIYLSNVYGEDNEFFKNKTKLAEGSFNYAGYFTVKLTPEIIRKDSKFAIIVKIKTPGYRYPIAIEKPIKSYSSKATAKEGQSFLSKDGEEWADLTKKYTDTNVCIKAFTAPMAGVDTSGTKVESIELTPDDINIDIDETYKIEAKILPDDATNKEIIWYSTNPSVAKVDGTGLVEAVGYGNADIVARSNDGSYVKGVSNVWVDDSRVPLKAKVITDKKTYKQGETSVIDLTLTDYKGRVIVNKEVSLKVVTSHGDVNNFNVVTDKYGKARQKITVDIHAPLGQYTIYVNRNNIDIGKNVFNVVSNEFNPIELNPILGEVSFSKTMIQPNESVKINTRMTDKYKHPIRYVKVNLTLISPDGEKFEWWEYTDSKGVCVFDIDGKNFAEEGTYKLNINADSLNYTEFSEDYDIIVGDFTNETSDIDLTIVQEKSIYQVGDRVKIDLSSFNGTKPLEKTLFDITVKDPIGRTFKTKLKSDEKGLNSFVISTSANTKIGKYLVKVEASKKGFKKVSSSIEFELKKAGKYIDATFSSPKKIYSMSDTAYIYLNVKDENGQPLRNANVNIEVNGPDHKTTIKRVTDYYGVASLYISPNSNLSQGEYSIKATVSYFDYPVTLARYKIIFGDKSLEMLDMDISVNQNQPYYIVGEQPIIEFKVNDIWENPVASASIDIKITDDKGNSHLEQIYTNNKGVAKWALNRKFDEGVYQIDFNVEKYGYNDFNDRFEIEFRPDHAVKDMDIRVDFDEDVFTNIQKPGFTVLTKDDNLPLEGAKVYFDLRGADGKIIEEVLETDRNGKVHYQFENSFEEGVYEIRFEISRPGYKRISFIKSMIVRELGEGDLYPASMIMSQNKKNLVRGDVITVDVEIKDKDGNLLPNKQIVYTIQAPNGKEAKFNRSTNKYGKHRLRIGTNEKTLFGNYKITCRLLDNNFAETKREIEYTVSNGYTPSENKIIAETVFDKDNYELGEVVNVTIKARDQARNKLADATVDIKIIKPDGKTISTKAKTNSEGLVRFNIAGAFHKFVGEYTVSSILTKDGYKDFSTIGKYKVIDPNDPGETPEPEPEPAPDPDEVDIPEPDLNKRLELTFEDRKKLGEFSHLDDRLLSRLERNYGKSITEVKLIDDLEYRYSIGQLLDNKRPMVLLFGNPKDEESYRVWREVEKKASLKFKLIYPMARGGKTDQIAILTNANLRKMSKSVYRNGAAISNRFGPRKMPFVLILDREGRISNISYYNTYEDIENMVDQTFDSLSVEEYSESNKVKMKIDFADIKLNQDADFNVELRNYRGNAITESQVSIKLIKPNGENLEEDYETDEYGNVSGVIKAENLSLEGIYKLELEGKKYGYASDNYYNEFKLEREVERKELTFEDREQNLEFEHLDKNIFRRLRVYYGKKDLDNMVLYNQDNKPVRVKELYDTIRPTAIVVGNKEEVVKMEELSNMNREEFSLVYALFNGSAHDLSKYIDEHSFKNMEGNIYRNGAALSNRFATREYPFVILLDRDGTISNVFVLSDMQEFETKLEKLGRTNSVVHRTDKNKLDIEVDLVGMELNQDFGLDIVTKSLDGNRVSDVDVEMELKLPNQSSYKEGLKTDDRGQLLFKVDKTYLTKDGRYELDLKARKFGYEPVEKTKIFVLGEPDEPIELSLNDRQENGEFEHMDKLLFNRFKPRYARDINRLVLFDIQNKPKRIHELREGDRPSIMIFGIDDKENADIFRTINNHFEDFNKIFALSRGSARNLESLSETLDHEIAIYRNGGVVTNQFAVNKFPFFVILDRTGKIVNIGQYNTMEHLQELSDKVLNTLAR